jgi:hypothetical protein
MGVERGQADPARVVRTGYGLRFMAGDTNFSMTAPSMSASAIVST